MIFTGYLLIYNVLYISISRDIRFYGLLKTVGTTPKQIRCIVTGQIFRLCAVGIPLGAVLASVFSLAVIPTLVSYMGSRETGTIVSFSPLIYSGAADFALLTAFLGAVKPAKKAANISPIEAQKYTGTDVSKKSVRLFSHGKPYRMALRNIFRDRKRDVIVFLSMFLSVRLPDMESSGGRQKLRAYPTIDGANVHDVKLLEKTLENIVIFRPVPTEEKPQSLCLDADFTGYAETVVSHKYIHHIRPRGEQKMEIERNPGFKAR